MGKAVELFIKDTVLGKGLNIVSNKLEDKLEDKSTKGLKKLTVKEKKALREIKYEEHYQQVKVVNFWKKMKDSNVIPSHWRLFRNANTQYLTISAISWAKQEGLESGIPDLTCMIDNKILFIEMKRMKYKPKHDKIKTNGLNDSQKISFKDFQNCGFTPQICYSAIEAIQKLSDFTGINLIGLYEEKIGDENV